MLTAAELAGMALDVLPEAPCRVVCLRDDGAKTELRVLGTSGTARLQAELPVIDAFVGARNWSELPSVVSQLEEARAPGSSLQLVELAPAGELDLEIASRHVRGASAYL